ncbi:MAG: ABC-2 type transport system ATP-binding protein [Bacteriovoracaceae bacterium]|jgi:ABC-2 type transport system ATP-binding protein
MIKVKDLTKTFKVHKKEPGFFGSAKSLLNRNYIEKSALKSLNLNIEEGEIIGLIGSNGAGKTTLTKILSGIIHPTSGEVSVMGHRPWDRNNQYRKQMAVIMGQKAQLWWDLPAMDGFLLLKEIYQIPHKEFYDSVDYLAEYLKIKDQLNIQVRRLSLGERMKVELMAALIHKPKVIFLDEPTIGLDLTAQKAVRKFIKEYRKEHNPTMILTSHYMDDIEELCPRICILKDGQSVYDGQLDQLHKKYVKNKMITANIKNEDELSLITQNFPQELGRIEIVEKQIKIHAPRENTMEAAKYLLNNSHVLDLNIQEVEIGEVIEKIMNKETSL